jgi:hypothetical protein
MWKTRRSRGLVSLRETLGDRRMRRRVSGMSEGEILGWLDNLPHALGAGVRAYSQYRAPDALTEIWGQLRSAAALAEGLEARAGGLSAAAGKRPAARRGT